MYLQLSGWLDNVVLKFSNKKYPAHSRSATWGFGNKYKLNGRNTVSIR